ncbi:hypothetical protein K788_0001805 (plasmid) [Paraburkholderia caribensis MBA4]|uniref:Antitoxin Xre/MbcA/ParS-like toxin-binding domain-containing protein n=1 Tax=Paraburkholderia caribensis MBA4 TaxID=1323664 RepID=A0A0P0RQU1_9BURK|nr:hypothetical protein [Paraburkholderia caribensis]ALL71398.1 hypothetical protein K788_0001805 [Paraburkholderia caribensis MBA4]
MNSADKSSAQSNGASAFDAALDFRERLLANSWPDESELLELLKRSDGADAQFDLALMRSNRVLLGVWSATRGRFLYPDFQLNDDGQFVPEVTVLLRILSADADDAGWRRAFWLYSPHALLDGRAPSSIFALDPMKVLEVATAEFNVSSDEGW